MGEMEVGVESVWVRWGWGGEMEVGVEVRTRKYNSTKLGMSSLGEPPYIYSGKTLGW